MRQTHRTEIAILVVVLIVVAAIVEPVAWLIMVLAIPIVIFKLSEMAPIVPTILAGCPLMFPGGVLGSPLW